MAQLIRKGNGASIVVETELIESDNPATSTAVKNAIGEIPKFEIMENIADLTSAPTKEDFNGLLASLIGAGLMKEAE